MYINFQVTTLVNHPKKKGSKLGKSKNAHKLAQDIEDATARLIKTGEDIAQEFPEIREEMLAACKDCRGAGGVCSIISSGERNLDLTMLHVSMCIFCTCC